MYSKVIKYVDYNGTEREETFLFNLSKAELMEMELTTTGGLGEMINKIIETQDIPELIKIFKELILKSYGVKSPDGKQFIKSAEIAQGFSQTEAYSNLFMELVHDDKAAADFINGIIPKDVNVEEAKNQVKNIPAPPLHTV